MTKSIDLDEKVARAICLKLYDDEIHWIDHSDVASAAIVAVLTAVQTDAAELARLRGLYEELLFAVGNKHPVETRHQTALRYIQQAEEPRVSAAQREGPNDK